MAAWSDANEGFDLNYEALRRNSFKELKNVELPWVGLKQEVIQFAIDEQLLKCKKPKKKATVAIRG